VPSKERWRATKGLAHNGRKPTTFDNVRELVMAESAQTPTLPPPRILDAALAHPGPASGPALDAILAHNEQTLPSSDDTPLADGRVQQGPLGYSRDSLRYHFRGQRDRVAVEGDMFVYYVGQDRGGKPAVSSVAPDVYVVFGVPDRPDRDSYVLYHEPEAEIRFVLEIASKSTRARDHGHKRRLYASLGVPEYFLYDPPSTRRPAHVTGLTLSDGRYQELPQEILPNGHRGVRSDVLQLAVYVREGQLHWYDPASGQDLVDYDSLHGLRAEAHAEAAVARDEAAAARDEAEAARDEAAAARDQAARAEARVAELEALLKARDEDSSPG